MKIPKKVYLTLGGGLGDVFCSYFRGENGWGYLDSFKKNYPDTEVKVLSSSHNPQTEELVKYNPHISSFQEFGWTLDGTSLWAQHAGAATHLAKHEAVGQLERKPQLLYISEGDNKVIQSIYQSGKFIFLHPFAGLKDREALTTEEYFPLVDKLIDHYGYNVVVIGATHKRRNLNQSFQMVEEFNYDRPGLFNLVNKTNARISWRLAELADSFIGCWSAYSCAFWIMKKKTTVILKEQNAKTLRKKFASGQRWYNRGNCRLITTTPNSNANNIRIKVFNRYQK